jgi:hypothetical protein
MRFDKSKDPAALAAKDPSCYATQGVAVVDHGGGTFLAATDGHALTLVRCTMEDGDDARGVYPSTAFAAARKAARRKPDATVTLNGAAYVDGDGAHTEFAKVGTTFPDTRRIVPTGEPKHVLRLDAAYLARIQKALDADGVEIRDYGDGQPLAIVPIYLAGGIDDGSLGVLMPIKAARRKGGGA